VALEASGPGPLHQRTVGTDKNVRDQLQTEYAPRFSAHSTRSRSTKLFARIKSLYDARARSTSMPPTCLLERRHDDSCAAPHCRKRESAHPRDQHRDVEAGRSSKNVLAEVNDSAIDTRERLKGMSDEQIAAAAEAARRYKLDGKYVIALLNTTGQPAEAQLENVPCASACTRPRSRSRGNRWDNTAIVEGDQLRAERAKLVVTRTPPPSCSPRNRARSGYRQQDAAPARPGRRRQRQARGG
jgi:peptidyl-dipeptidase Dcp